MLGMIAVNYSSKLMMSLRSSLSCLPHSPGTCKFVKKNPANHCSSHYLSCWTLSWVPLFPSPVICAFLLFENCNMNLYILFCFKFFFCFYLEFEVIFPMSEYSLYFTRYESKSVISYV